MPGCVVQVCFDRDLLAGSVSGVASVIAIEMMKHGFPCFGISVLICEAADRVRDHAVDYWADDCKHPPTRPAPSQVTAAGSVPMYAARKDTPGNA